MNTVFKLGYQAWLLLASPPPCALPWAGAWLPRRAWPVWAAVTAVLLLLGAVYPYAGTYARKDGFSRSPTLDGLEWLRPRAPGDPAAIAWLRANTPGDAVVLEAVGDDYSAFGHGAHLDLHRPPDRPRLARPRAAVGPRPGHARADVRTLYTPRTSSAARELIGRYGVAYVVVRPDRAHHLRRRRAREVGRARVRVFDRDGTTVWRADQRALRRSTPACRRSGSTACAQ